MDRDTKLTGGDAEEQVDHNRNGLDDSLEPPSTDIGAGTQQLRARIQENPNSSPVLSGGDVDAQWEMAESSGDETVAGSMPTPGQNDVGEIGKAMGVEYADDEELKFGEKERKRDLKRWELDPASSEDYKDRIRDTE